MILIKIGTIPLWADKLWSDYASNTWGQLSLKTWNELRDSQKLDNVGCENNSFEINDLVEDQSTADFKIWDQTAAYHFTKGMPVEIFKVDGTKIFGGYVDSVDEQQFGVGNLKALEHTVMCVDNHYLVKKRKINKAFDNEKVTDCVTWIYENILQEEGITVGAITASDITITKICNFTNVADTLDDFAEYLGYTWFIDCDKKLYFIPRSTYASPWNINVVNGVCQYIKNETFKVSDQNNEFRDIQYILGGNEKTDLQTETKIGDGQNQTWPVAYPLCEEPTITVNAVEKTVGIKGVETGKDFYWNKNDNTIAQDPQGTKLISTDTLVIQYYGTYPITVKSSDYQAIADRAAVEGNSGKVEEVLTDNTIITKENGLARANALLAVYAVQGKVITYDSEYDGIEAGQLQHIKHPLHNLDHDCLITEVMKRDEDGQIVYSITAVSGPVSDYWVKTWMKASQKSISDNQTAGVADVLQVLDTFIKNWQEIDSPNIWKEVYPSDALLPGGLGQPAFDEDERLRYLQLNVAGGYRRYRTQQTRTATQIITTVIVPSADANGAMSEASLWGGNLATATVGTGKKLSTHSYVKTKNALESLLLIFYDNKWS